LATPGKNAGSLCEIGSMWRIIDRLTARPGPRLKARALIKVARNGFPRGGKR
jgi:hypothetical protein